MRAILTVLAVTAGLSAAQAGDFRLYPGFTDRNATVEMTSDKGLIVEITLRCSRNAQGQVSAGIMTYSKLEGLFCDPNLRCTRDPLLAFERTCG